MSKASASVLFAILVLLFASAAQAQTQYVTDQLSIQLRRGPGTQYAIDKLLKSGTQVQVLSSSNGWSKVRTSAGKTGFVLTRFLADDAMTRGRYEAMKKQLAKARQDKKDAEQKAQKTANALGELKTQHQQLSAQKKQLKQKYSQLRKTAASQVELAQENKKYKSQVLSLENKIDQLTTENGALKSHRQGMKLGAIILIGGIILGLILPLFRRRRNRYGSF